MEDGALGLSTSLQYVPDLYNSTEEIIACAKVAAARGGVYFTHQRSEGNRIDASLAEVFRIAREAKIPANVWHLKTAYRRNWGTMPKILAAFAAARATGLDVAANQYPWNAASNGLDACLPPWAREGGRERLLARLARSRDADAHPERDGRRQRRPGRTSGTARGAAPASCSRPFSTPALKKYEGGTLEEIGAVMKKDPRDALMDIVLADRANSLLHPLHDERRRRPGRAQGSFRRLLHGLRRRRHGRDLLGRDDPIPAPGARPPASSERTCATRSS